MSKLIREWLLSNKWVYRANQLVKTRKLKKDISSLSEHYLKRAQQEGIAYSEKGIKEMVAVRLNARQLNINSHPPQKPRIFFAGTNYFQDSSGIMQALNTLCDVVYCYNDKGEYGLYSRSFKSSRTLRDENTVTLNDKLLLDQVTAANREEKIDYLIGQLWANYLSPETLAVIRNMGIIILNISMDDRLPEHWITDGGHKLGSIGLASETDLVLTTTKETCLWYLVEGAPSIYWPLASDMSVFFPVKNSPKNIDVCFVGARYGIRNTIVMALMNAGINVTPFGPGWPAGIISPAETVSVFQRSKIILGIGTVGHTSDVFTIKLRDFDAPMSGTFYLTHRNSDLLESYKEGTEIECYLSISECINKIKHYLENEEQRDKIAKAGYERSIKEHTWLKRFTDLFELIQSIQNNN